MKEESFNPQMVIESTSQADYNSRLQIALLIQSVLEKHRNMVEVPYMNDRLQALESKLSQDEERR